ncbi:MAG: hypothetical protein Udaeo2_12540 [Candidatus Udaeobacter sp.]|nr:MAG: hypothetical protein Udaeo2_12540 [Candidatus Udaeobacter sp.]
MTLVWSTLMPTLSSSPNAAPQSGLPGYVLINGESSRTFGLRRVSDFQRQNDRNPARCQRSCIIRPDDGQRVYDAGASDKPNEHQSVEGPENNFFQFAAALIRRRERRFRPAGL